MKWAIVKYEAPETPHHDAAQGVCDRVMHAPHNAEGHFLSLGSPLDERLSAPANPRPVRRCWRGSILPDGGA
jgi:hypothetical protein